MDYEMKSPNQSIHQCLRWWRNQTRNGTYLFRCSSNQSQRKNGKTEKRELRGICTDRFAEYCRYDGNSLWSALQACSCIGSHVNGCRECYAVLQCATQIKIKWTTGYPIAAGTREKGRTTGTINADFRFISRAKSVYLWRFLCKKSLLDLVPTLMQKTPAASWGSATFC